MTAQSFSIDIDAIRQQARRDMSAGPVTGTYGADPKAVIDVLNDVLATEIVCWMRYSRHAISAAGINRDMHPPGRYLQDEQHVQPPEEDRVHGEEVTRQQALGLRAQEVRQEVSRPRGAGRESRARRIRRTVAWLMWWPRRVSSPCTRRYPQSGLGRAI